MTVVAGGFPREVSPGIWVGAEDFERFPIATGVPAGLRMWASDPGGSQILDAADGEGHVFEQNTTNATNLSIDNFEDLFDFGEILCRIYIDNIAASGQRVKTSPGGRIWEITSAYFHTRFNTFNNSLRFGGLGNEPIVGTVAEVNSGAPGGFGPFYCWVRMRYTDAGSNTMRVQINTTYGSAYDNPPGVPVTWDIDEVVAWFPEELGQATAGPGGSWGTRLGWLRTTIGPTQLSNRRMSYFAFSTDPTFTIAPPLPSEVVPLPGTIVTIPSILAVDPLQGTYVGLQGSAYESSVIPGDPALLVIPGVISDAAAVGAWEYRYSQRQFDAPQQAFQDLSGNGNHLYHGTTRDSLLGDGFQSGGIRGIVHGGEAKTLGLPNTALALNLGGSGETVRITVNFTMQLGQSTGTQSIISHDLGTTTRAWTMQVGPTTDLVSFFITEDGTTLLAGSTLTNLSSVFASYDNMWMRFTIDFTADTVTAESSVNGVTWVPFGSAVAFGTPAAGLYQPAAGAPVWLGAENSGISNLSSGAAIYSVLAEEDPGGGFAEAWSYDFSAFTAVSTLQANASQGVAATSGPAIRRNSARIDAANAGRCGTLRNSLNQVLAEEFDLGIGEVLTVVLVAAVDWITAGAGAPATAPIFSHKNTGGVDAGWELVSLGAEAGFRMLAADGATLSDSGILTSYPYSYELNAGVFEWDGPAGEFRSRRVGEAPEVAVYNNGGASISTEGFLIGANGVNVGQMDLMGAFVIKRALTTGEMATVATFLSAGRL